MDNWKKTFLVIWTGQIFSILSSSIVGYAIAFWLSIETGSASVLAISTLAAMLPQAVLGLFTGVFIDRWNRKRVMMIADSYIALCTLALAVLFFIGAAKIWHIYLLLALRSVGSAFHSPAMQASVPLLAPESQLMRVAGINQTIVSASSIAGPVLGALFINIMDMSVILLLDVAGAVIAVTSLFFVRIPNPDRTGQSERVHIVNDMKEAILEILSHRGLATIVVIWTIIAFFSMPVGALFPLMTLNHFTGTTYMMSIVEVAWGAGMLMGGALVSILNLKANKVIIMNLMYITMGVTFLWSGLLGTNGYPAFVALTAAGGVFWALQNSAFTVIMQTKIKPSALGRVFSFTGSVGLLPSMIGLVGAAYFAEAIGLLNLFITAGSAMMLLGVASFALPSINHLKKETP